MLGIRLALGRSHVPAGDIPVGTHTISAYTDMGCEVVEGNEINNSVGPVSVAVTLPPPGDFDLMSPVDDAVAQPVIPTLQWGASNRATSYEYCVSSTESCPSAGAWVSNSTNVSVALSGRTPGATYYWQVRPGIPMD